MKEGRLTLAAARSRPPSWPVYPPRHAVDRFLEHNVFYTIGQCTIQEGWNGFKRGSNRSGGQTGRAHNFANNWPETGKLAFFWRIRRLIQSTSLGAAEKGTFLIALVNCTIQADWLSAD
jgi:hypothetical protein